MNERRAAMHDFLLIGVGITIGVVAPWLAEAIRTAYYRRQRIRMLRRPENRKRLFAAADALAWQVAELHGLRLSDQQHAHIAAKLRGMLEQGVRDGNPFMTMGLTEGTVQGWLKEVTT